MGAAAFHPQRRCVTLELEYSGEDKLAAQLAHHEGPVNRGFSATLLMFSKKQQIKFWKISMKNNGFKSRILIFLMIMFLRFFNVLKINFIDGLFIYF